MIKRLPARLFPGILLPALLAALLAGCVSPPGPLDQEPEVSGRFFEDPRQSNPQALLEARVAPLVEEQRIPGFQLGITGPGQRIALAWGSEGPGRETPLTVNDQFRIGGVTALYTSVILLSLVEEGRLSLEEPVSRWLPQLPGAEEITVAMLLQDESGLAAYSDATFDRLGHRLRPRRRWEPRAIYRRILRQTGRLEPGSLRGPNASNFHLLALLSEEVTGDSYSALLQRYIVSPLGLEKTSLPGGASPPGEPGRASAPPTDSPGSLLDGYEFRRSRSGARIVERENRALSSWAWAAGGLVSTAAEMSRFIAALFDGRLISTELLEQELVEPALLREGGIGLRRVTVGGVAFVGNTGGMPGFEAFLLYSPEAQLAVAASANRSEAGTELILEAVVPLLAEGGGE
ncbi:MAG: serine hydrolase domain-containing protein [Alkalispirochaetaceae bacterium]